MFMCCGKSVEEPGLDVSVDHVRNLTVECPKV